MRIYSVELAIQELDDKRMLRIRQEVRWIRGCRGLLNVGWQPEIREKQPVEDFGSLNRWFILPSGGLYATYHLLWEPETTID